MRIYFFLAVAFLSVQCCFCQTTYTFTGNGYWSNTINWSNAIIPPSLLPAGSAIIISPSPGDSCVLDVAQTISSGANIVISTGANFIIQGNLQLNGSIPLLSTTTASSLTASTAASGGNISNDGGSSITARGVVWSVHPTPLLTDNKTVDGLGAGIFTSNLNNLSFNTTYHVRAYATNSTGTAYGDELIFSTLQPASVQTCNQRWTSQNLDIVSYRNGDIIPQITSKEQWDTTTTGAWCYYGFQPTSYEGWGGKLYNAYAISDPRGFAPLGWHVPFDFEWTTLVNCFGGEYMAGGSLMEPGTAHWEYYSSLIPTNSSGFTALGAGRYEKKVVCNYWCEWAALYNIPHLPIPQPFPSWKRKGSWWTTTQASATEYIIRELSYGSNWVSRFNVLEKSAYSVRCVEGELNLGALPIVTTDTVWTFGSDNAILGGNIPNNNLYYVTERGVVWDTLPNPTIANNRDSSGTGFGHYTINVSGLRGNKTYYVRAYAINNAGLSYGNQVSFTTAAPTLASVNTWFISNNGSSAETGNRITAEGGTPVTARGVVWDINPNPTIANNHTQDGSGPGTYTSNISGLSVNTSYYLRSYATTDAGIAYGNQVIISTSFPLPPSVIICDKIWTQQNLNISTYNNGDPIPEITDAATWANLTTGAWCWFNNDSVNYSVYGKLYNGYAVNDPRGLIPEGWHLPTMPEWDELKSCLGPDAVSASNAIRETGTLHWNPNIGATNSSGFTALPSGMRAESGAWFYSGYAWFRTTPSTGIILGQNTLGGPIISFTIDKGAAIRCIRN